MLHDHPNTTPREDSDIVERLVPMAEICVRTGWDRSTVLRNERKGLFPQLRRKGSRKTYVLESEFVAWMRAR